MPTLVTVKKWSLFRGGHYLEGQTVKFNILIKKFEYKTVHGVVTDALP
jgi:hypothetical protein